MRFIRQHPRISTGAALLLMLSALMFYRKRRINTWDLVNHPPTPGPVVCFGDSLVYGSGATDAEHTYPAQLDKLLSRQVIPYGYPGATSQTALQRLRDNPEITGPIVVVTLGGNDFLRRIPQTETLDNLAAMFTLLQERNALVVYTGVPNGRTSEYRELCKEHGVLLVPELLRGIINDRKLKADQIHPNDQGYRIVARRIAQVLEESIFRE